ncbi:phage tail protein [Salmonella enterica subsp. enterica serovar Rissen]|uniref:Phage tail protein n=20 Tax=Enterobacteriaceae TaxID=543 RepID=A0A756J9K0_SALER|nr:phage tail protein [Salmonella enterica subsp. enterica serovar Anatum]ECG2257293.1 phage tail protein [Salmonella enterica subsp. enterica serovar Rissen]HAF9882762.1 phage tail protein [Salmonella enterica]HCT1391210.1 phage tail protein [Salmonella enterica subsp. enterica serovar Stanley]ECD3869540.1 phage tail protein [Salmonella enterica subsp. enterica serovar Anatum]
MTVKYYAILTNQGAARLANATMLGSKLNLTQMAVGDANGVLPTPDPAQTKLINQKRIAPLNLLSVDPNNQSQIIAEQIIPENEGGFWIREIGLYDDEGVLIAVANCPETYKPQLQEGSGRTQTIRMILVVTNTEAITLKIDPSVVLATRKYVDDKISEHEQSRRHPDASLTAKGFTQLSSAINSESETLAATPKAVKAAYDLANGKYTAQNATTIQKGIVQLSSATNSTSETLAATPKAVKAVMDETNKKAPLNSPALTGTPTTPTAPQGTNSTQIASTAFVMAAIAALVDSSPDALNTLNELAAALGNDPNFATTMTNALAGKQPKDATLTALAELATSADKLPYFTGADRAALTALTSVGRAILGKPSTQGVLDYLGLGETINLAAGALQKSQNGGDIPDKKQFARTIGAVTSTTITLGESGWFKIATVVMPQATSTAVIKLYGGAGFNAGSPEQAAISELVLRAGNGSPVGITATLWRRSPAAANEVAWVNTSGDTYDIYINIGQYAYWLIAQYDYTGNANVTLHSTPEYSSVQPGNSTSGQTYTIYSSLMKPTAGDVGALPITGGQLNGPLSIGTDNALGGNSIVLGDNDTGFKQNGDGILDTYANNQHTVRVAPGEMMVLGAIRAGKEKKLSLTSNNNSTMTATFNLWGDANRPTVIELDDDQGWQLYSQRNPDGSVLFTVNGDITANVLRAGGAIYQNNGDIFGSLWGNGWLSTWINNNLVLDVQLGAGTSVTTWNNAGSWPNTPGYVVTSVWKDYQGENIDGINYAPLQKRVGNQWYTVQGGTV